MPEAAAENPLAGSWELIRWEISFEDDRPSRLPFGPDATGLLLYTEDGSMSAIIERAGRAPLSSDSPRSAPQAERLAAFESCFVYAGSYALKRRDDVLEVVHRVTHSLNPGFRGSEQIRRAVFADDGTLTLSARDREPGSGVSRSHRLIWRRK